MAVAQTLMLILSTLRVINILLLATVSPSNQEHDREPKTLSDKFSLSCLNKCMRNGMENMHANIGKIILGAYILLDSRA